MGCTSDPMLYSHMPTLISCNAHNKEKQQQYHEVFEIDNLFLTFSYMYSVYENHPLLLFMLTQSEQKELCLANCTHP